MIQIYLQNRNKFTDLENELLGGKMVRRDSEAVWDRHIHTTLFKIDNVQGPTVQHRELWSMLYVSLDGRGVQGIMDIYG